MIKIKIVLLTFAFLFLSQSCGEDPVEPESKIGHLKITVTYPDKVLGSDGSIIDYQPAPGEGVSARLYPKGTYCLGYKDAKLDIAYLEGKIVNPKYRWTSDSLGIINFSNIRSGEYYLLLFSWKLSRYTELDIEVPLADTLGLHKDFTKYGAYVRGLEPWDETMYD